MARTQVIITGDKKLNRFFLDLPKHTEREMNKAMGQFIRFVQKSAKLRAPRFTGRLIDSIKIKKGRKNERLLVVGSPYAAAQEFGFQPHFIHSSMSDRMGNRIQGLFNRKGFFFVKKHTPFIAPAFESGLNQLPKMVSISIKKSINKSGR